MLRALGHHPGSGEYTLAEIASIVLLVGVAFLFYLVPSPLVYMPALIFVVIWTWQRLPVALSLVVLFAPFTMLPKHLGRFEFAPAEIFLWVDLALAAIWLFYRGARSRPALERLRRSPFFYPALLFVAAGAVSTLFAADRHVALRYFREWVLDPVLFFGLLVVLETRLKHWWALYAALLGAGLLLSVIALVQRVSHQNLTLDSGSTLLKVRAVYGSPDNLGLFLDRVIPVWLGCMLFLSMSLARRVLMGIVGIALLLTLLLTFSRGAWFATGVACLAILATRPGWGRWVAAAAIVVGLAAIAIAGPKVANALRTGHANTAQQRIYIWQSATHMIRDHPVVGIGPDNFVHYYAPQPAPRQYFQKFCSNGLGYLDARAANEPCLSHPHNEFLDFWLNAGIGGLVAFVWIQGVFWWRWAALFVTMSTQLRVLLVGGGGAMLAGILHGLVDNGYFLLDLGLLFWFLVAFVSYLASASAESFEDGLQGHGREAHLGTLPESLA